MSRKRNFKRKKPISSDEIERRKNKKAERIERKKQEKKFFWKKCLEKFSIFVFMILISVLIFKYCKTKTIINYYIFIAVIIITVTDKCGLCKIIFKYYPNKFPLSAYLKKDYPERAFGMELSRTLCYYSLCFAVIFPKLMCIWSLVYTATIIIGYNYIISDKHNEYTFDKFSKFSDTPFFLILSGLIGFLWADANSLNLFSCIPWVVLGSAIITILYLVFAENKNKAEIAFQTAFFSALNILGIFSLLQTSFENIFL